MIPNKKLNEWISACHLSRRELADSLGLSSNYIWRLLSGNREVSDGFRWKFGKKYGFKVAENVLENGHETNTDTRETQE